MIKDIRRHFMVLAAVAALGALPAAARQISPEQALESLRTSGTMRMPAREQSSLELRHTFRAEASDLNTLYLFTPAAGKGFVLMAADDVAAPVLAYSDTETLNPDELPANARAWIENYSAQIAAAAAAGGRVLMAAAPADRVDVAPIMTSTWNQDAPYNNMCPMDGSSRSVTGCVATAIAQVLRAHRWPTTGVGAESYSWRGKTLSFNYGATTFAWDSMLDNYPQANSGTSAQRDAVATLMYACGVAAHMGYSSSASGATEFTLAQSLIDHMRYDKSLLLGWRDYYQLNEWTTALYDDLKAGRPVFYTGATVSREGHAFVLDGYRASDGFFHLNWGWGGMADGYFAVTDLTPNVQGIGGGSGGFVLQQTAFLGLKKAETGSKYSPFIAAEGFSTTKTRYSRSSEEVQISYGSVTNLSFFTPTFDLGLKLVNTTTQAETYIWWPYDEVQVSTGYGFDQDIYFYTSSFPTTGTYSVTPVVRSDNAVYPMHVASDANRELTLTCTADLLTFAKVTAEPQIVAKSIEQVGNFYVGKKAQLKVVLKNEGNADLTSAVFATGFYYTNTALCQFDNQLLSIGAGQEVTVTFSGTIKDAVRAGEYSLILAYFPDSGNGNQTNIATNGAKVKVLDAPGDEFAVELVDMKFSEYESGRGSSTRPWTVPVDPAVFSIEVACTQGVFDGYVGSYLLTTDQQQVDAVYDGPFTISSGASKVVNFSENWGSKLAYDTKYIVRPFYGELEGSTIKPIAFSKAFYIKRKAVDGVVEIEEASGEPRIFPNPVDTYAVVETEGLTRVDVYTLNGALVMTKTADAPGQATLDVAGLASGIYIVTATTPDGTTTLRMIKN